MRRRSFGSAASAAAPLQHHNGPQSIKPLQPPLQTVQIDVIGVSGGTVTVPVKSPAGWGYC
jgi:hypothetical protein